MGSKWRKAKLALGLNLCTYMPKTLDDSPSSVGSTQKLSDASLFCPVDLDESPRPITPSSSSKGLRLCRSSNSRQSSKICSICLTKMKDGAGQAIFTAECSHSFHFHCIASNVQHGNRICPVCRAKWKEVPMLRSNSEHVFVGSNNDAVVNLVRSIPGIHRGRDRRHVARLEAPEPGMFDDDERLDHNIVTAKKNLDIGSIRGVEIETCPEVSAVPKTEISDKFSVLIHLRAGGAKGNGFDSGAGAPSHGPRAPVDLVTVLDVSGSMAGTKLALLKQAMGFVIQQLGSNDRLSVVAFSSTARRIFPLRRMSEPGRQLALRAVNSLVACGGTNIVEGLRKGAKVMEDRRNQNPVSSIILLSDGQDTYSGTGSSNCQSRWPQLSLPRLQVPVHTFGFGADHDASSMHSISENSGGTFSFIESEAVIQDALAQCIGGLLSVAAQELQLSIDCPHPNVCLRQVKAGSYGSRMMDGGHSACINVGDMYADEERDFLLTLNIPMESSGRETPLVRVKCVYKDPITKTAAALETDAVRVKRTDMPGRGPVSIKVDRQRNRFDAAEAMTQARAKAEQGDLGAAVSILRSFRQVLSETVSAKSGDNLCVTLDAELKEMQEKMASKQVYETSGRAYILSGLSSHSWQRATARGGSAYASYQTPSMAEMLNLSQTTFLGSPSNQELIRPLLPIGSLPNRK